MEEGSDIKATLAIAMQTENKMRYIQIIHTTITPLYNLHDPNGVNIFHEIAQCVSREATLVELLEILLSEFSDRYFDDSKLIVQGMLNVQRSEDGFSPFLTAVLYNRKVIKN